MIEPTHAELCALVDQLREEVAVQAKMIGHLRRLLSWSYSEIFEVEHMAYPEHEACHCGMQGPCMYCECEAALRGDK